MVTAGTRQRRTTAKPIPARETPGAWGTDEEIEAFIVRLAGANEATKAALWNALRGRALAEIDDYTKTRVLSNDAPVTNNAAGTRIGFTTESYFDRLNFRGGTVYVRGRTDGREAVIQLGGAADCMFTMIVSSCFALQPWFTQGMTFTSLSGCTFTGWSTVQGAVANHTAVDDVIFICPGLYQPTATINVPAVTDKSFEIVGAGENAVVVQPTSGASEFAFHLDAQGSSDDIVTSFSGFTIEVGSITSSGTGKVGIGQSLGATNVKLHRMRFEGETGGGTRSGISCGATTTWQISQCTFKSMTNGMLNASGEWDASITGCTFMSDLTNGINAGSGTGGVKRFTLTGNVFLCPIGVLMGGQSMGRCTITANEFICSTSGVKFTGGGGTDGSVAVVGNFFQGSTLAIDLASVSTAGDTTPAYSINDNTFVAGTRGIRIHTSDVIACTCIGNTFQGYSAGNEISSTSGTTFASTVQICHNETDSGTPVIDTCKGHLGGSSGGGGIQPRYNAYITSNQLDSWLEGAALTPSAGSLTLGTDGDMFHVAAGNFASIATPTRQTLVLLVFDGVSVLTHSANLILQGAVNYTSAAGDTMILAWEGGTVWREINRHLAAASTHNLLNGSTHPDTVAQTPTKGSIPVANATPAWDEFVIGDNGSRIVADSTQTLGVAWIDGVGTYFDAIVDNADPYDDESGINVYSTIALAIAAGHKSIFVRGTAGDASDITIASGDSVRRILGADAQTSLVPVNITCNKSDVLFESLQFFDGAVAKSLKLNGARNVAFACVFLGALANRTALVNMADGSATAIVSSTDASPINIQATGHGLSTGNGVRITGHTVNTNANGDWTITFVDANNFTLNGSLGNGAGAGGATGTVTKLGLSAAATSITCDNNSTDPLPANGIVSIEGEVIGYHTSTGSPPTALTLFGSGMRGVMDTLGVPHADNTTITALNDGHLVLNNSDCQVIQCRFIACNNALAHCLIVRALGSRARLISNVYLLNTVYSVITLDPEGVTGGASTSNLPAGVQIVGSTFDTNTVTHAELSCFPYVNTNSKFVGELLAASIAGSLFTGFTNMCIEIHGASWNIAGNTFTSAIQTTTMLVNRPAGLSAGDTTIVYDTLSGAALPSAGLVQIESEFITYHGKTATQLIGCTRGALGTTAATHADNTQIQNLSQRVFYNKQTQNTLNGALSHLITGCSIDNAKTVTVSTGGSSAHCRLMFADNQILSCTNIFSEEHANWLNNLIVTVTTFDCRAKTNQVIFGGKLRSVALSNVASDTFIFVPGAVSVTGVPTTLMIPTGRFFALGRAAGDLVSIAVPLTNKTGANSVAAACVCVDNATDNAFDDNPGAASTRICGVCVEGGIADGSPALVAIGGVATVTCTTAAAVVRGDTLEFSATGGQAQSAAAPVAGGTLGKALTAKAAVTAGSVKVLLNVG